MLAYRLATIADLDRLAELNLQLIEDEGHRNPMGRDALHARMATWLTSQYRAVLFEQESQIVAYALYRDDSDFIYLRHFFVAREHRRRGVGRTAVDLLLTRVLPAAHPVRLEVLVTNEPARAFWEAVGFVPYALTMERANQKRL